MFGEPVTAIHILVHQRKKALAKLEELQGALKAAQESATEHQEQIFDCNGLIASIDDALAKLGHGQ